MSWRAVANWRGSLSARVLITSFLFVVGFIAVTGVIGVTLVAGRLRSVELDAASAVGRGLIGPITAALATGDRVGADLLLQRVAGTRENLRYIIAVGADGSLQSHSLSRRPSRRFAALLGEPRSGEEALRLQTELGRVSDVAIGPAADRAGPTLHLGVADDSISGAVDSMFLALSVAVFVGLAVGGVIAVALARWISAPLLEAAAATDAIAATVARMAEPGEIPSGEDGGPLLVSARSSVREVAVLIDSFNRLSRSLHESRASLGAAQRSLVRTERMAALGTFVAGTAHAINNPLGGVRACLEMLEVSRGKPDRQQRYLEVARAALGRIESLVQRMVFFVRAGKGSAGVVGIDDLVVRTAALDRLAAKEREAELVCEPGAPGARVRIVPAELEQALTNLVVNAIQASPVGGKVLVRTAARDGEDGAAGVEIRVEDRGVGMSEQECDRAFEPFFTTKPEGEGTGLGLWIVWKTANRYGGSVRIVPRAPGTSVQMWLPLALAGNAGGADEGGADEGGGR